MVPVLMLGYRLEMKDGACVLILDKDLLVKGAGEKGRGE